MRLAAILVVCAGPVFSETMVSAGGVTYGVTCNDDGAVLRPYVSDDSRLVLYLGQSCDAFAAAHGEGLWGWANGGVAVAFDGHRIGFPRQEPPCATDVAPPADFGRSCDVP